MTTGALYPFVTLLALSGAGPPAASALPDGLEGHFAFGEQPSERAAVEQAIEATAQRLSFVVRGIARSRLRAGNRIAPWVEIRRRGEEITVQYEGRPPMSAPATGAPTPWKDEKGTTLTLQHRVEGDTLVQVLRTPEGARTNRLSVAPGGGLRMAVEISSPRLPAPMKYVLSYTRGQPAAGGPELRKGDR
jgi:hypothetical protein